MEEDFLSVSGGLRRLGGAIAPVFLIFLVCTVSLLSAASASDRPSSALRTIDVPSADAVQSLKLVARQAGVEIVFFAEDVGHVVTPALRGVFLPLAALEALVEGTELVVVADTGGGPFTVRRRAVHTSSAPSPHMKRYRPLAFLTSLLTLGSALSAAPPAAESPSATGVVTGVVRNVAIDTPLSRASVAVEPGSKRALTDDEGRYRLTLPAGNYIITVAYAGLDPQASAVQVAPGLTAQLDFALTSEIYRMEDFVVRSVREDSALSLQQQRYSSNPKTVLATDAHGAPADNPGELLQRMAGISTNFEQGEAASVSIRGMGQQFARMTVDGEPVATSFGNFLQDGRSFILTERATNNLSQIELIKAPTPDQDADSIAGTINLVSRRHFDRPPGLQVNATLSDLLRDVGETADSTRSRPGRYGRTSVSYNNVLGIFGGTNNLGVAIDSAWSRVLRTSEDTGPLSAGTLDAAYVTAPGNQVLTRNFATVEVGGPIEKFNTSASVDYRLKTGGFLFFRSSYTLQERDIGVYQVRTINNATTAAAFAPGSTWENSTLLPAATSRLETLSRNSLRRSEQYNASIGGDLRLFGGDGTLSVLASFSHAVSRNPYVLNATAEVAGIGFQIDRQGSPLFNPRFRQTAGPSWSEPANYRIRTIINTSTLGAPTDEYTLRLDYKHQLQTALPLQLKAGLKHNDQSRYDRRTQEQWTYVGPDGIPNSGDETLGGRSGERFRLGEPGYGPFPFLPKVTNIQGIAPASHWRKTAAQAYTELTVPHARGTEIAETATAGYVMGTIEWGQWRSVFGVRAEQTELDTNSWLRNTTAAWGGNSVGGASVDPAVVAANIARAERSYVRRQRVTSRRTEVFPGAHLVWEPRDALILRGSYNRSIARPNINQILPTGNVNEDTRVLTIGNPDLMPYLSDNFEVSVERYLEPVGLVSAGVFYKRISRYFRSFSDIVGPEGIDGAGTYAGFERTTARNVGSAEIEGLEVGFQQQFRRLPGWLSGLGAFANFTYLRTEGDFGSASVTNRLPNMTPRTLNAGVSYVRNRWQIRPLINWQDRTYRGTSGVVDFDSASRTRVDLKVQYALGKRYSLECSVFNVTNQPDFAYISSDRGLPFSQTKPGTAYSLGVTGRF